MTALALILAAAAPAASAAVPLSTYVEARAAEMNGDESRSAQLYALMAEADPADRTIARKAISTAIQSGQADLAISLAKQIPPNELPIDARLMLAADQLRRGKNKDAAAALEKGVTSTEVDLFGPVMKAWDRTARGKNDGIESLSQMSAASPLAPIINEQKAAMLFALGKPDDALPLAQRVLVQSAGRNTRLRLAYADSLVRLKRKDDAMAMLQGDDEALAAARSRVADGKLLGMAIATPSDGYAELLLAMAIDLGREDNKALPIALTQVARHANPGNSEGTILLALLYDGDGRSKEALALLDSVRQDDLLAGEALDVETRILGDTSDYSRALTRAQAATQAAGAGPHDFSRLANVLGDMDRHTEAAAAYGEAINRTERGANPELWTLHLLRAASLEQADRWGEAKVELETALKLDPDNALLLNFLGYGKLERGEDLDTAEAMIRKASALRPDDASITDSLGWALFKRGRVDEAIETLSRAAAGDPSQAEIHEHLGDALYSAGRRIEARFSWQAALITAEDQAKSRLERKMELGLNTANAAP
ncbi:tetratricopeptide repeat protein [Sphingomonas sp. NSE70-1]|uniref:Tetratricopeptide repeat protein n=1 Tax=Sphingomonas caseinilyticus TaxID=2908205 RepID=A0ABT0RRA1_9SPHN|nr:tetratricopeptide repeat protein [Sphingomonas caseinilyticus]MCL6697534.1 tetratricopeptide repeat protein [Sphingomonas caseinilyticus]